MTLTIVVAMGEGRVIGADGGMPWHLPKDLAHFKTITLGHPMIMGRKTFEAIGRALPGRTTIVVTRQSDWSAPDVVVAADLDAAVLAGFAIDDDVFLVGGGQVYAEALSRGLVGKMIVTHVDAAPEGDTLFPPIDPSTWRETGRETFTGFDIATYEHVETHGR